MRSLRSSSFRRAFTLIELLIVVAIIAILAAIAVPNFLEAQTRAKVSRAKSDMRSISVGIESYNIDYSVYPPNPDVRFGFNVTPKELTTPIAYITSRPIDPFKLGKGLGRLNLNAKGEELNYDYFEIITATDFIARSQAGQIIFILGIDASGPLANVTNQGAFRKYGGWLQWSVGPDGEFWILEDDFQGTAQGVTGLKPPAHLPWGYSFDVSYDPTNGTSSFGNIIRCQKRAEGAEPYLP